MAEGKRSLLSGLGGSLSDALDPNTGLSGRTFERTQGCWNCRHFSHDKAKEWWKQKRQRDLDVALGRTMASPMGENEPSVVNIRRMVDAIDTGLASGQLGKCLGSGVDANDNPVGDLVRTNYLCRKWDGAEGSSVARAGQAADPLPMELEDKS